MSKPKKRSIWAWVGAIVAGCGLCCIPLIVPLFGGAIVAGGVTMSFLESGWLEPVVCTLAAAVIAVGGFWLIRRSRRKTPEACTPNLDPSSSVPSIKVKPLE